jgi:hypothetical protein
MDLVWKWKETIKLTNSEIMDRLNLLAPDFELYSLSLGWRESSNYILKARGVYGDIVVYWEEEDYE